MTGSHDHRSTVFYLAIATLLYQKYLWFVSRHYIHNFQLPFPRPCYNDLEEGTSVTPCTYIVQLLNESYRYLLLNEPDGP